MLLLFGACFLTGISGRVQYSSFDNLDGIQVGSKFFYLNAPQGSAASPANFNDAKEVCEMNGGKLAIPQNADEDQAISSYIEEHFLGDASQIRQYDGAWIGIYMLQNGTFMDIDGNQADYVPLDFHSRLVADFDICLSITQGFYFSSSESIYTEAVMWDESFCGRSKMPLCEIDLSTTCKITLVAPAVENLSLLPHEESCEGSSRCFNGTLVVDTCTFPTLYSVNETACVDPREVPECDVNECLDPNACPVNSINCTNEVGTYTCECDAGYEFNDFGWTWNTTAWECSDIDECAEQLDDCSGRSSCNNFDGGFDCICHTGFYYENFTHGECVDYDECHDGIFYDRNVWPAILIGDSQDPMNTSVMADVWEMIPACPSFSSCANQLGAYNCTCDDGYMMKMDNFSDYGFMCEDFDECASGDHMCDENAFCDNDSPGYNCTCMIGYIGDGWNCTDVDECADGTDMCDDNAVCDNFDGGYNCTCEVGWEGSGFNCTDVDECLEEEALRQIGAFDDCDINSSCNNLPGSYNCTCDEGYFGDGFNCTDVDECDLGIDMCDDNAECGNFEGGYNCTCVIGWEGDGFNCTDVDECAQEDLLRQIAAFDDCDINSVCQNLPGSYNCTCMDGFTGNGTVCEDIDECSDGSNDCHENAYCMNFDGGFNCTCMEGYFDAGSQNDTSGTLCEDFDECLAGTDACHNQATCNNTDGSYTCDCNDGFYGDGFCCKDSNECGSQIFSTTEEPTTTTNWQPTTTTLESCEFGPISLPCPADFEDFNGRCYKTLSSSRDYYAAADRCQELAFENDSPNGYIATFVDGAPFSEQFDVLVSLAGDKAPWMGLVWSSGFYGNIFGESFSEILGDNDASFFWAPNFPKPANGDCVHFTLVATLKNNDCSIERPVICMIEYPETFPVDSQVATHNCSAFATCANTFGDYECFCNDGYNGTGFSCEDVDECALEIDECGPANVGCVNFDGGYNCTCEDGYRGDGFDPAFLATRVAYTGCEDIDECSEGTHMCHDIADCTNFDGGYNCTCHLGYEGDGFNCTDVDECREEDMLRMIGAFDDCDENSHCSNFPGGYNCTCNDGFQGDGFNCTDIDECAEDGTCHDHAFCDNFDGGFNCTCIDGYQGDGFNCTDIDECADGSDECVDFSFCTNFDGGYNCTCEHGLEGDALVECVDIDECATGFNTCGENANCTNTFQSYECSCNPGFHDAGYCPRGSSDGSDDMFFSTIDHDNCINLYPSLRNFDEAINICQNEGGELLTFDQTNQNDLSMFNAWVFNIAAGLPAWIGYTAPSGANDPSLMTNIYTNEPIASTFNLAPKHPNIWDEACFHMTAIGQWKQSECTKFRPTLCIFDQGPVGEICEDIDECAENICAESANCVNSVGSFECTCPDGFSGDGFTCEDINECDFTPVPCATNANCNNFDGGFECLCAEGFEMNANETSCVDINECADPTTCSDPNSSCINTEGSFSCDCNAGYELDTSDLCVDINECLDGSNQCFHQLATCANFDGGYECICADGYEGDGLTTGDNCTDIDECSDATICDAKENSECVNTVGSYDCACKPGFLPLGTECLDFNECLIPGAHDNCDPVNGICDNTIGSYECSCPEFFSGNGTVDDPCVSDLGFCLYDELNIENAVMTDCSTSTDEFESCTGVTCAQGLYLTFDGKDPMNIVSECTCDNHVNCTHTLNKNVACVDCPDNDVITWFGFSTNQIKVSGPTGGLIQSRVEANLAVTSDWSTYTVLLVFPGDLTDARIFTWVFDVANVILEADGSSTMVVLNQNANSPSLTDAWSEFFVGLDNVASIVDSDDLTTFKVGVMPGSIANPDCVLDTNADMPSESSSRIKQRKERKHARRNNA